MFLSVESAVFKPHLFLVLFVCLRASKVQVWGSFGAFWSIWDMRSMEGLGTWSSSTGYAKEEGRSHLEDQLDRLLDQPVEFLNSTGQASTRSS
ncbi:unnamed protein product [Microthlaspi erraticum]|uniref:Secreted protein n=1 Tax=Microthlaspi erraticum TaxID=1685480 RepID=A0A6D2KX67_9BRAS|nr:unnamed protein product [Microthlaspi erraticum]